MRSCEGIAFSPEQTARVFAAAKVVRLPVKLHADQLSNLHGARLAAEHNALSADHLEYTDEDGVDRDGATPVRSQCCCPARWLCAARNATARRSRRSCKHKVPFAIATDSNPGTSPITSLLRTMNMAATLFRLTVEECLVGVTRNVRRARSGALATSARLRPARQCDLAIWNIERPAELVWCTASALTRCIARVYRGQ